VAQDSYTLRPQVQIVAGRLPKPGTTEAMIGRPLLSGAYAGVHLGGQVALEKDRLLDIVGVFEAQKTAYESEIWADLDVVRDALGASGHVSSITVQLASTTAFDEFKRVVESDKRLGLAAERERDYYEKVSSNLATSIRTLGLLVSVIFSLGAALGAAITMYGQVAQRRTEVGVLLALGFKPRLVLVTFVAESALLAVAGGALGVALACLTMFVDFSVVNWASDQSLSFHFLPTPRNLTLGFSAALAVGVLGGVFPALRASRSSPISAMRRR
jgi:putative ABC transport system permease protein